MSRSLARRQSLAQNSQEATAQTFRWAHTQTTSGTATELVDTREHVPCFFALV